MLVHHADKFWEAVGKAKHGTHLIPHDTFYMAGLAHKGSKITEGRNVTGYYDAVIRFK